MLRLAALVFSTWVLLSGCTGPTYSYSKAGSDVADNSPHRSLDDPREFGDSTKLVLVEPAEERNSLQMSSLRIAGGLGLASVCLLCLVRIMEGQAIRGSWVELHSHLLRSPVRLGPLEPDSMGSWPLF